MFLTRRPGARRIYATVVNAGNNTDGFKEQGEWSKRFPPLARGGVDTVRSSHSNAGAVC